MAQRLLPGVGYIDDAATGQRLVPGVGYTSQTSGGTAGATAPGATLTGTATITGGTATGGGGGAATAPAAGLTGTATITAGSAFGGGGGTGTLTTRAQQNNTATPWASQSGVVVFIWDATTGALVLKKTGLTLDASGVAVITDAAIVPGTSYVYDVVLTGGARRCNPKAAT